jgi:ligand-binding SRPBCC domain-containing protein
MGWRFHTTTCAARSLTPHLHVLELDGGFRDGVLQHGHLLNHGVVVFFRRVARIDRVVLRRRQRLDLALRGPSRKWRHPLFKLRNSDLLEISIS